jgi:hypothetical protein
MQSRTLLLNPVLNLYIQLAALYVQTDNKFFETAEDVKYLEKILKTQNYMHEKIKTRLNSLVPAQAIIIYQKNGIGEQGLDLSGPGLGEVAGSCKDCN